MKYFLILFFGIFQCSRLSAQHKLFEEVIGWRGNHVELHTISDKDKKLNCMFLINSDSLKGFLLDNQGTVIQRFNELEYNNDQMLGGFIRDNKVYIFFYNEPEKEMHTWIFDNSSG